MLGMESLLAVMGSLKGNGNEENTGVSGVSRIADARILRDVMAGSPAAGWLGRERPPIIKTRKRFASMHRPQVMLGQQADRVDLYLDISVIRAACRE